MEFSIESLVASFANASPEVIAKPLQTTEKAAAILKALSGYKQFLQSPAVVLKFVEAIPQQEQDSEAGRLFFSAVCSPENLAKMSSAQQTALFVNVLSSGNILAVEALLKAGLSPSVPIDEDGTTPLVLVCECGHLELADLLISAGADPNEKITTYNPLHEVVRATPLSEAVNNDHLLLAAFLVASKADPKQELEDGSTPLATISAKYGTRLAQDIATFGKHKESTIVAHLAIQCIEGNPQPLLSSVAEWFKAKDWNGLLGIAAYHPTVLEALANYSPDLLKQLIHAPEYVPNRLTFEGRLAILSMLPPDDIATITAHSSLNAQRRYILESPRFVVGEKEVSLGSLIEQGKIVETVNALQLSPQELAIAARHRPHIFGAALTGFSDVQLKYIVPQLPVDLFADIVDGMESAPAQDKVLSFATTAQKSALEDNDESME